MRDLERNKQDPKVTRKHIEILRNIPGEEKFELAAELYEFSRKPIEQGLLDRGIPPYLVQKEVIKRCLPREIVKK